ncbi:hypothetical protein [Staphylococcus equorum]|uniref:Uncharacterized protein n=1 Tax=Staphylococcus equorum TaxID=246432 RepID=A0AAP7IF02_9STAP|nr:hypothetical protein [Staphylococcus equorum]OEK58841.1 hypothetical protein ASS94_01420 [Staphylococcus equorum]
MNLIREGAVYINENSCKEIEGITAWSDIEDEPMISDDIDEENINFYEEPTDLFENFKMFHCTFKKTGILIKDCREKELYY